MKFFLVLLFGFSQANANITRSNISNVGVTLYGVYMTSDPSCQTGLIASVPLVKTPTTSNFVNAPVLGSGVVPVKVACVVLVVANQMQIAWQAGTYSAPDNVCAAGGAAHVNPCVSTTIVWPSMISQNAQAIGLSMASSCGAVPLGTEVVPVYMSIHSACTGNSVIDQQISGCSLSGKTTSSISQAPSSMNNSSSGAKIQVLPVRGRIVFAVDPDQIISGQSGVCSAVSAPVFSIHQ